ncbi:substrate-binding periplasmic protein [Desulfosediminicola flagellatus]|uniref:substrate-binding periplasmic protein n=1 Tax=Desulfosediminicola flagellatus TaxID=2569541 RepID=UPI0010ACD548|nr:transporter substrate-binding domain-containing protein [Desulfosediminicola flagellatus]
MQTTTKIRMTINAMHGILLLLLSVCIPSPLFAQQSLVLSAIENTPPLEMVSEVLRRAYQKIDITVEIIKMPGKRALRSSSAGLTDGEAFRYADIEVENQDLIRVDVVIRVDRMHLYTKRGEEFRVDGWKSIPKDYVIGYQRGLRFAEKHIKQYGLFAEAVNSTEQVFLQLSLGRIDVGIHGADGGLQIIQKHDLKNIVRLDPPIYEAHLYHYLHRKHALLVPKITTVLADMKAQGEFERIQASIDSATIQHLGD